ncbi:hypothetical protein HAX54_032087, partial [Datura stramonium]|nr:hypothetical protein [Datura stramonium]
RRGESSGQDVTIVSTGHAAQGLARGAGTGAAKPGATQAVRKHLEARRPAILAHPGARRVHFLALPGAPRTAMLARSVSGHGAVSRPRNFKGEIGISSLKEHLKGPKPNFFRPFL